MPVTVIYEDGSKAKALTLDIENEETYVWESQVAAHPIEGGSIITDSVILANPKLTVSGYISNKPLPSTFTQAGAEAEGFEQDNTAAGAWSSEVLEGRTNIYDKKNTKLDVPGSKMQYNASAVIGAVVDAIAGPATPSVELRKAAGASTKNVTVQVWKLNKPDTNRITEALGVLLKLRENKTLVNVISDVTSLLDCIVQNVSLPRTAEDGQGATFSVTFEKIKLVYSAEADALGSTVNSLVQKKKAAGSKATKESKKDKGLRSALKHVVVDTGDAIFNKFQ